MVKILFAALLLAPLAGAWQTPGVVLENSRLRLVFDPARGGALTSFLDKRTNREWISPDAPPSLYTLTLRQSDAKSILTTEKQAVAPVVKLTRQGRSQIVTITTTAHQGQPLGVRITCTLPDAAPQLSCRIHVTNRGALPLSGIRFPTLALPLRLADSPDDDRVLLPMCDGMLLENPEKNLADRQSYRQTYPGTASLQLWAFYDPAGGFSASTRDAEGYSKDFSTARAGKALTFSINHAPDETPRQEIDVPYPIVLGAFQGDWQTAAGDYREWARKQPWTADPLLKSTSHPAWLMHPPFIFTFGLGIETADHRNLYRDHLLPAYFAEYAKLLDTPVWAVLTGWEKNGTWIAPDYFPPRGGDVEFKSLTASLHDARDTSGYFLSGLRWTLEKTNPRYTNAPYSSRAKFDEEGERNAVVGEDGKALLSGKPETDVGVFAELCIGTRYTQDLIVNQVLHSLELGVTSVQLDQAVGGGTPRCYSKTHGHPPGGGNWSAKAFSAMFARIREEGHRRNPDFAFLIEEPGEFYIPLLDAYHGRDYAEGRWPRSGAGIRGVPLFTHVYHEYLLGNGGDSAGISATANTLNVYTAAMNLVAGKIPGAALWSGTDLPAAAIHPAQLKILQGSFRLMKTPAREYLLAGERLPTPPLDAPSVTLPLAIQKGTVWTREDRNYPGILYSAWTLPGGKLGYVFVNLTDKPAAFDFPLHPPDRAVATYRIRRYDASGPAQPSVLARPYEIRLELAPHEPLFFEALPVTRPR